jgi:hypothetical protein
MVNEIRVPSFGEDLIGIDTSIENPTEVEQIKIQFAELAEKLKNSYEAERSPVKSLLFDHAIGELVSAQMAVVKVLTYKPWASDK